MTDTHLTMTDELISRAMNEMAAGSTAERLVDDVMRAVDVTPQGRASWLGFGGRRSALLLVAVLLLLGALAGAILIGSKPPPLPPQTERTLNFNRPFEYMRPGELDLGITTGLAGLGLDQAHALEMMRRLYAPCPNGCSVGALDSPVPLTEAEQLEYATHLNDWNAELSRVMTSFTVGGPESDRGVILALPGQAPFGFALWCFGPVTGSLTATSQEVLNLYGSEPWGQILTATETVTFDDHEAVSVRSPAGRCPTSHPSERQAVLPQPGVLTLVQVDEEVVVVAIWGATDAVLGEWLPTAGEFIETIHFIAKEPT